MPSTVLNMFSEKRSRIKDREILYWCLSECPLHCSSSPGFQNTKAGKHLIKEQYWGLNDKIPKNFFAAWKLKILICMLLHTHLNALFPKPYNKLGSLFIEILFYSFPAVRLLLNLIIKLKQHRSRIIHLTPD